MLKPQDGPTRDVRLLDGLYRFRVDHEGTGFDERWFDAALATDLEMAVPGSYNDVFPDPAIRNHVGWVWYQREVSVPAGWDGSRVLIRLDAATHEGRVFVDGTEVAAHAGGYTPFGADITDHVRPGERFRLTIAVNNELTQASIPPGRVETGADGRRIQRYLHDFYNYSGLHRSVRLVSVPATHVADLTVVTGLDGARGEIGYTVRLDGAAGGEQVGVRVLDADGTQVGAAEGAAGTVVVDDVVPWRPGAGYLYRLLAEVRRDGVLVDSYELPVGVRTVEVRGTEFLINGEPFHFTGFGMHEDHGTIGKGHNDALMVADFRLLDWTGANSFRTAHYPYSEEVMDYADRHGIVVIDETAAVGLNMMFGGVFEGAARPTYVPGEVDAATAASHRNAIRELIARDKNRPSVVLWSIANEPNAQEEGARGYFEPLAALARELDPTRPIGYVNVMFDGPDKTRIEDLFDVCMLNRYYGWYTHTGDLPGAEAALEAELRTWAETFGKPILLTEYGADTMPGQHSLHAAPWSEEYQAEFLDMYHRVFDRIDAVVGEHVWNFADFQTSVGIMRVDGNKKGVFTRDRRPKAAAHALRRRWRRA
ncbi:beta-glucuronidase [Zafaria sp. Z1313]|uniref:beta-glucuronidase n=1 Tax=unclassified Zafaria TaxID=2828765 RepID=UPI002E76B831|nr:beta-glucuronidase [Zafaria sp. J156]MEE1621795.1 beta-glucuronidase [Zafaria sp. J156]